MDEITTPLSPQAEIWDEDSASLYVKFHLAFHIHMLKDGLALERELFSSFIVFFTYSIPPTSFHPALQRLYENILSHRGEIQTSQEVRSYSTGMKRYHANRV